MDGEYDDCLHKSNLIEYADQELLIFELLKKNPFYFEDYGFEHIIVDEFQDTSQLQFEILKNIINSSLEFKSFLVVGDDSQSIFGFRGSDPRFIIEFEKKLGEDVQDFYLLENHRSTENIINFANKINSLNQNRVVKDLIPTREKGEPVVVEAFEKKDKKRKEDFIDKEKAVDDDSLPDLEDVNTHYDTQINLNEEARTYPANERMPFELKGQANVLKRKVEKIFHNMQKPILRGRRTGQLDAAMAYKLAMNQMDCFMKKGEVSEFDGCAYFLADNSGSMQGNRQENCCKALAKIEHAFQDVMPLKIVAFNADDCYSVRHQVLKNWSEKVSSNGSYNFLTHCYANGGNKDGYSIRVATEELLHRPERKKILIVLSDGLPSAYEKNDGEKDVNDAVRKARKAGISVISIFFGDDSERSAFVKMYEKNCIITEPEGIDAELVRLMKRFCFR